MLGGKQGSGGVTTMEGRRHGKGEENSSRIAAADDTLTTTITTTSGHVLTISEFISRFDEASKRRLNDMKQKLRDLEQQMEVLEAEMCKANGRSVWGSCSYDA